MPGTSVPFGAGGTGPFGVHGGASAGAWDASGWDARKRSGASSPFDTEGLRRSTKKEKEDSEAEEKK